MNKVYLLNEKQVNSTIEAKAQEYSKQSEMRSKEAAATFKQWKKTPQRFSRRPCTPIIIRKMYKDWIAKERDYYAKVRVVKIGVKKYILVYGDTDDATVTSGTGPFKTLKTAKEWFFNQGR